MKLLITCLMLLMAKNTFSQTVFYDAKALKTYVANGKFKDGSKASVDTILSHYLSDPDATITSAFGNNPFLEDLFPDRTQHNGIPGMLSSVASSVGGLDVTNIADGLARFLIKRGKEELNMAFFSQFKLFLDKHEECKVLFPKTVEFLSKIETFKYAAFLQSLRESFYTDLSNLIIHLNQVVNLPKYQNIIENNPEIKFIIASANIVTELSQTDETISVDSVISQLAALPWSGVSRNVGTSVNLLNLLSQSIRETDASKNRSWVQLSELNKNLFTDSITLRIYFGLLYQQAQAKKLRFYSGNDSISVNEILAKYKDHIFTLSGLIENFAMLATDVDKTIQDIKTKVSTGSLSNDDYYTYISKAVNIIDYGFTMTGTLKKSNTTFNISTIIDDKYIAVARNASDLYKNIYVKNYNNAVMNVCTILDSLITDKTLKNLLPGLLKYGNFMASVVKSQTPEEAQAAIEAAALPAGSSSIKKNTAWSVSLNAYIGGYFGKSVNETDKIDGNSSKIGVTAPVGIALSKGLGNYKNGSVVGSLSLFATLIDVGAIVGYRLSDESTALESKVTLKDIFTPGGYLVYGFGLPFLSYVPLSVGYGWQYGSKLYYRKLDGTLAISDKSRWGSNWFVAIDIPLANLWTKGFKK